MSKVERRRCDDDVETSSASPANQGIKDALLRVRVAPAVNEKSVTCPYRLPTMKMGG
jgi:hypothetical protein